MDIMESALASEINAILYNLEPNTTYRWVVELHVDEQTFPTMKVLNIDFDENPETNIAPSITVRFAIEGGTYYKRILPNDHRLEATIYKYTLINDSSEINFEIPVEFERYTATIFNKHDANKALNLVDSVSEQLLNISDVVEVQLQLINKAVEQLRIMPVGGVYRKCRAEDVLVTCIQNAYRHLDVDEERLPIGVDINGVSNTEIQETFVIPHGTRLMDLPDYIQNEVGGVYNSGIGSFIKGEFWYIYPKYNTVRFGDTQRTLTIIKVPPNKLPSSERTYRVKNDTIMIISTEEGDKYDLSEIEQLNAGNGTRFASASHFLELFNTTENNRTTAARGARVNEFLGQHRSTEINHAPVSGDRITANPYKHYTNITKRQGNILSLTWENSDMDLILPGMLVKVLMLEDEEIVEYSGVLLRSYHGITLRGKGMIGRTYITRTVLNIFIDAMIGE